MSPFTGLQVPALYLTSTSIENVSAKKKKKKERNVKNPQETNWKPSPDDSQKKKRSVPQIASWWTNPTAAQRSREHEQSTVKSEEERDLCVDLEKCLMWLCAGFFFAELHLFGFASFSLLLLLVFFCCCCCCFKMVIVIMVSKMYTVAFHGRKKKLFAGYLKHQ